ncbi:hypothetical protein NDU88_004263 [Pleurodeles waltl]|uniref:Uncharacterized protein n=1 Tax=Pleurodeles waltl TaxID=8319 RepID=A0AAV7RKH7_PLEWA|nr:hypothetical protein NDU88_004263 [Pleurodeles waltl]
MVGKAKGTKNTVQDRDQPLRDGSVMGTISQLEEMLHSHSAQFVKVLQAILKMKTSLESRIVAKPVEVTLLRADHRNLAEREAREREGAIMETSQLSNNPFSTLADKLSTDSDNNAGTPTPSQSSHEEEARALTPRMADDL